MLAGYTAGFGYELTKPSVPPANISLAPWLSEHHLTYGLSGYWTSSSVTVNSGQRVKVRALMQYTLKRDLWMAKADWYDPKLHHANFVVLDSLPGFMNHWEPRPDQEVLRRSGPDLPSRSVHDHGLGPEPAQGPSRATDIGPNRSVDAGAVCRPLHRIRIRVRAP